MLNFIRSSRKGYISVLLSLTIAAVLTGCTTKAETSRQSETPPKKEVAAATQTPGMRISETPYAERQLDGDYEYSTPAPRKNAPLALTKASFEKVKTGMTLDDVEKLMGEKGMLVSTMDINGRKTQIYKWSNNDFSSYIDVTIENGKVVEKKDKGLK